MFFIIKIEKEFYVPLNKTNKLITPSLKKDEWIVRFKIELKTGKREKRNMEFRIIAAAGKNFITSGTCDCVSLDF